MKPAGRAGPRGAGHSKVVVFQRPLTPTRPKVRPLCWGCRSPPHPPQRENHPAQRRCSRCPIPVRCRPTKTAPRKGWRSRSPPLERGDAAPRDRASPTRSWRPGWSSRDPGDPSRAGGMETAAAGDIEEQRHVAADQAAWLGAQQANRGRDMMERPIVRVHDPGEDGLSLPRLHDPSRVHHRHLVGDLATTPDVVGDEQHRQAELRLELPISFRICAWMVTSRAVVGSSAIRSAGRQAERHGDHRPLAHPAGELVRFIAVGSSWDSGWPRRASISTERASAWARVCGSRNGTCRSGWPPGSGCR